MTIDSEILSARILIVDDQKVNARLLEEIFRKAGYKNITCVHDSRDAQAAYAALKPHAVILDINMPYMDGFQIIQQLKETRGAEHLPILMLTQLGDNDLRFLALESGARDYLNKPYDAIEVLLRVRNMIEVHLSHDRLREENKKLKEEIQRLKGK
ncbi:MAG: response regulator [Candidatus Omnitrophica bacterium]|nr:response regulator [Candidatus Omnitrophota bacterium]